MTLPKNTMTKPKQPPKNFFRYFLDEYILFRRDFAIETPASVEDCTKSILALSETNRIHELKRRRLQASHTTQTGLSTIVYFKVIAEQFGKRDYVKSAVVEGTIESANDTTLITGKVQMSASVLSVSIVFGLVLFVYVLVRQRVAFDFLGFVLMPIIIVILFIISWILMYRDRNYLVGQIQQAIHNAEMESTLSKTKNEPITQPSDDSSEQLAQQKGES